MRDAEGGGVYLVLGVPRMHTAVNRCSATQRTPQRYTPQQCSIQIQRQVRDQIQMHSLHQQELDGSHHDARYDHATRRQRQRQYP